MRIDYAKLILLLLPIRMRMVRIFSLLHVLIMPIQTLHDEFQAFANRRRLRASATPQPGIIEQLVLEETGVSIQIIPVDTLASPDFEVKHPDDAPAAEVLAAKSVIDRYKMAGMTYRVQGSAVPFSAEWTDAVCALQAISAADSAEWTDRVCAIVEVNKPVCIIGVTVEEFGIARLVTNRFVASDISVTLRFTWYDDQASGGSDYQTVTLNIIEGYTQGLPVTLKFGTNRNVSWALLSGPTPDEDSMYKYAYSN